MKLHNDIPVFTELIKTASHNLLVPIKEEFVEKDYWITLLLHRLARSKYAAETVFKGGTSLSKGFGLISRFSEDVDIAIINNGKRSGNEIKTIIRTVEKEMAAGLKEIQVEGVTSKGSRFRKSVFEYPAMDTGNKNNRLIAEVNSFANPFPFQPLTIKSFVYDFLLQTGNEILVEQYGLQPFTVNVLNKEQTMLEKLVSLIRFSFAENAAGSISNKIRHFYDLYFLLNDAECNSFAGSGEFKKQFDLLLQHDREIFDEPEGWQNKSVEESPLLINFSPIWEQLKGQYQTELSALAYRPIPKGKDIAAAFIELTKRIQ